MVIQTITEPERQISVIEEVDVIVVGGGMSGVAAATAAAINGAGTLLIEKNGFLGGVATAGLMASMDNFGFFISSGELVTRGVALQILDRLVKYGGTRKGWKSVKTPKIPFDPEVLKLVLIEMVGDAGVKVLLHTWFSGVVVEDKKVKGAIVETKAGRQAVLGKTIVDASGDADVAARAGAPFIYSPPSSTSLEFRMGNVDLQKFYEYFKQHPEEWPSHMDVPASFEDFERNWLVNGFFYLPHGAGRSLKLIQDAIKNGEYLRERGMCTRLDLFGMDGLAWNKTTNINTGVFAIDALNPWELSKAELEARKIAFYVANFLKEYVPGFNNAFITATAPNLGVRVTRRIIGEYCLTLEDTKRGAKFDDVIAVAGGDGGRHPAGFEIPYRCMLPLNVDNLLVASGKSVSTEPGGLLRGQSRCIQLGEAAGTASALAVKDNVSLKEIDIKILQKTLIKHGVWLGDESRIRELGI